MSVGPRYNTRSPAVKRLMKEAMELHDPTDEYYAQPLEDNLFEWHFTVRGAVGTDFAGGVYHGKILLPPEYPMKPPSIILLTPNGRFEIGKKICLSMSAHHPETWQPSWSIRTLLLAIIGFMPSKGEGAIGAVDYSPQERKILAARSLDWSCDACGAKNRTTLAIAIPGRHGQNKEAMQLASQIIFKREKEDEPCARKRVSSSGSSRGDEENQHETSSRRSLHQIADSSVTTQLEGTQFEEVGRRQLHGKEDISDTDAGIVDEHAAKEGNPTEGDADENVADENLANATCGVRQRQTAKSNEPEPLAATEQASNVIPAAGSSIYSFVLLWIVVIALVVLILRRLCMDVVFIGQV